MRQRRFPATLYTYESFTATTQYSRVDKQSHIGSPKLLLHLCDCKIHTNKPTQQLCLYCTVWAILTNCITNQASSQIRRFHAVAGTNMVRNSNKFNVSDDTHMNTASNNTVVDWCTALNYSAEQIQWSLGNPDPQVIRKILGHLITVKLFQYTIITLLPLLLLLLLLLLYAYCYMLFYHYQEFHFSTE